MSPLQPLSLPDQVLAILRAQTGPAEVDYLVWRLRGKGYFACRVRIAVRALIRRGLVITAGGQVEELAGGTLVQAAPRLALLPAPSQAANLSGTASAQRPTNRLQQLLCSPLIRVRAPA